MTSAVRGASLGGLDDLDNRLNGIVLDALPLQHIQEERLHGGPVQRLNLEPGAAGMDGLLESLGIGSAEDKQDVLRGVLEGLQYAGLEGGR